MIVYVADYYRLTLHSNIGLVISSVLLGILFHQTLLTAEDIWF
jgi:hypothetical protein